MSILILAEHNNEEVKSSTLNTISAASKLGNAIEVLVIGNNIENISKEIANYQYVTKVLSLDDQNYEHAIAEKIDPVIFSIAENYSHIFAPATTFGKNVMPRVAVKLDVAQISDVINIESEDTFIRPIYAGNALATVKSNDAKKVITIRPTSFDVIAKEGGSKFIDQLRDDDLPGGPGDEGHSYLGLLASNIEIMVPALGGNADAMIGFDTSLVFQEESKAIYPE